ncbi:MAG: transcription activator GCR1-like domain-containing protein, partial [Gaiellaceae bacterium]
NSGASDILVTPDVPMQIQDNTAQENSRKEAGGDGVWVAGTSVRKKRRPNGSGPAYQSREVVTVQDTWREFRHGLNGLMGLEEMERKCKGWRRENTDTKFFIGRKPIYEEMKRRVDGLGEDEKAVADELEERQQALRVGIASKKKGKLQRHALQELGEALKEFHLLNGHVGPYTKPKMPNEKNKSACLGDYPFY